MCGVVISYRPDMGMCARAYGGGVLRPDELFVRTRPDPVSFSLLGIARVWKAEIGCAIWRLKQRICK